MEPGEYRTGNQTSPSLSRHIWVPFPFPPCAWIIISPPPNRMVTYPPHVTLPALSRTLWKIPLLFFADFALGLHHEIPGLCGHHAVELRQRLHQGWEERRTEGRKVGGGQGGRKWSKEAVVGEQDAGVYAPSFIFRSGLVTQLQVPVFE